MSYTPTIWQTGDVVSSEKLNKMEEGIANAHSEEYIVAETDEWLEENITQETGYVLDRSLQSANAAAPADIVGDIQEDLSDAKNVIDQLDSTVLNGLGRIPYHYDYAASLTRKKYCSGDVGSVIDTTNSSNNYGYASFDVHAGYLYKVSFVAKSTMYVYVRIVDGTNVVIYANDSITAETNDTVSLYVVAPDTSAKMYVNTYIAGGVSLLNVDEYDVDSKLLAETYEAYSKFCNLNSDHAARELYTGSIAATTPGTKVSPNTSANYKHAVIDVFPGSVCKVGYYARSSLDYGVKITDKDDILLANGKRLSGYSDDDWVEEIVVCPENAAKLYVNTYVGGSYNVVKAAILPERTIDFPAEDEPEIPEYYQTHIVSKAKAVNDLINKSVNSTTGVDPTDVDQLVFFTDYHYDNSGSDVDNTQHSKALIEYIMTHTGCSFVCHGGDVINNQSSQENAIVYLNDFREKFRDMRYEMYCCIGNHEYNATEALTFAQIFGLLNSRIEHRIPSIDGCGDYYIDIPARKMRYYFVGCSRRSAHVTTHLWMQDRQLEWLFDSLKTIPSGWGSALFIHRMLNFVFDTTNQEIVVELSNEGPADGKSIADGLDAYNARGQYVFNGTTYDYTNCSGKVIVVFTGHSHYDASLITSGGLPIIMTTTDCCPKRHTDYDWTNNTWVNGCTPGTVDEQAFDVVTIDKVRQKIFLTRVGYGNDRVFDFPSD